MSLNAYALTSVERLEQFIDKDFNSTEEAVAENIINAVTDFIENYCSRRFKKTTYTQEKYHGNKSKQLVLNNSPIVSGETFTLERRTSALNEDDWESVDSEYYVVDNDTGIVTRTAGKFGSLPNQYRVTYTAGYDFDVAASSYLTDVGLSDLEMAVWKLANKSFVNRKGDASIKKERLHHYEVEYMKEADLDKTIKSTLDRYMRWDYPNEFIGV